MCVCVSAGWLGTGHSENEKQLPNVKNRCTSELKHNNYIKKINTPKHFKNKSETTIIKKSNKILKKAVLDKDCNRDASSAA